MAAATHSVVIEEHGVSMSNEQALCAIFDIMEDAMEKLSPEQRTGVIGSISADVETPGKLV